jgi:hypothetical protein
MAQKYPVKVVAAGSSLGEFEPADYVGIDDGGTGAITAAAARVALDVPSNQDLTDHETDTNNPHGVDLADVGGEPANANIQAHIVDTGNPHGVDLADVGGEPANANIQAHIADTNNPHGTPLPQVYLVADAAARIALSANEGDEAIQADDDSQWIWDGSAWHQRPEGQLITIEDDGTPLTAAVTKIDFAGKVTVTEPVTDEIKVEVPVQTETYSAVGNSKEAAYKLMASMIFPGSNDMGVPATIKGIVYCDDASDLGEIKLFDATNGLAIAEVTGITAVDVDNILDFGTLSNVDGAEAVWEFQGRQTGGAKNAKLFLEGIVIYL